MFDVKILKGKSAFISGATGGIGQAIVTALAKSGCNLFLTSTDQNVLEYLASELSVYNVLGQKVADLINGFQSAGYYKYIWEANQYSSGLYFVRMDVYDVNNVPQYHEIKKIMLIK